MPQPTANQFEDTELPQISLWDLDYYCLKKIWSYLRTIDKLKLICVTDCFDEMIKTIELDWSELMRTFSSQEIDRILLRIGSNINKISYMAKYRGDYSDDISKLILLARRFKLNVAIDISTNNPYILTDSISKLISNLSHVRALDFSNNDITGRYLCELKNIKELQLRHCHYVEPQYFNEIMKMNRLKKLSIACCELLDDNSIETIVETQTELESIEIGRNYSATNIELICEIKSLKQLHILGLNCLTILSRAIVLLADNLEELTIAIPGLMAVPQLRRKIVQLPNLKVLRLDGAAPLPTDEFLRDLIARCSRLEELHVPMSYKITEIGILDCVKNANRLKVLNLIGVKALNRELFFKLAEVMQTKNNAIPLLIYCFRSPLSKSVLKTEKYKRTMKLLTLSFEPGNAYSCIEENTEDTVPDEEIVVPIQFFMRLFNKIKSFFN